MKTEDRLEALGAQVKSRTQLEQIITELNLYQKERAVLPMQDVVEQMRVGMSSRDGPAEPRGAGRRVLPPLQVRGSGHGRPCDRAPRDAVHRLQRARARRAGARHQRVPLERSSNEAKARLEASRTRSCRRSASATPASCRRSSSRTCRRSRARRCSARRWSSRSPAIAIES